MDVEERNIDDGHSIWEKASRDPSSHPVSNKHSQRFSKAITPLVKHKKALSSRGNSQTSLAGKEDFQLSDSTSAADLLDRCEANNDDDAVSDLPKLESLFTGESTALKPRSMIGYGSSLSNSRRETRLSQNENAHKGQSHEKAPSRRSDRTGTNGGIGGGDGRRGADGKSHHTTARAAATAASAAHVTAISASSSSSSTAPPWQPLHQNSNTVIFEGFPEISPGAGKPEKFRFSAIPRRSKLTLMVMSVANFGAGCAFSLPAPFFPREAELKGASPTMVGLVFSCFELVNLLMFPVFGNFLAEIGAKFLYTAGITVGGGCSVLFGFLDQGPDGASFVAMAFLVRIVQAIGMSAFSTASFAIVSNEFPHKISSAFAVLETFLGVGLMIGPTIGGALYEVGGFGLPFWVIGVVIMATGMLFFGCLPPPLENRQKREGHILHLLASPQIWVAMTLITAGACSFAFFDPTLALHLEKFDLSTLEISLFFVIAPALYALLAPLWGYLSDTRDIQAPLMLVACLVCASGFLMVGPTPLLPFLPREIWFITLGLVLFGVGIGCTTIPTMKCIVLGARELGFSDNISTFGLVSGLFNANFHLGAFVGPTIGGALVERIGFEYGATIVSAVFLFGFLVTAGFFGFRRLSRLRGGNLYSRLTSSSNKQHSRGLLSGGRKSYSQHFYNNSSSNRQQNHYPPLTASETTPLMESGRSISQSPRPGRFLQSMTFSSSGGLSW